MVNKKEEKKEKQICNYCKEKMDFNARHVLLGTYQGLDTIEEEYFHIDCFRRWHDEKTREKAQNIVNDMQKKAMGLMGNIQGVLKNITNDMGIDVKREIEIVNPVKQKDAQEILDEINEEEKKEKKKK